MINKMLHCNKTGFSSTQFKNKRAWFIARDFFKFIEKNYGKEHKRL